MGRITFTAEEHHEDIIEDVKSETDVESIADAVRQCIERAAALQQRETELQQRIADLETERDRLQRQLTATNQRVDEHQELVEYVEEERLTRQRARERRDAPVWQRAKWWIFEKDRNEG